jgi:hypothetical protein
MMKYCFVNGTSSLILLAIVGPPVAAKGVYGVSASITPGRDQGKMVFLYVNLINLSINIYNFRPNGGFH